MISNLKKLNKGFSLVEILIYVGIFSIISVAVITSSVVVISSFSKTRDIRNILETGNVVFERMTREIRQSSSVDTAVSVLGSNPGILQLNSTDGSGNARTVKFIIENGALNLYQNGVIVDNLLGSDVSVSNLIFRRIITTAGEAVKIEMTVVNTNTPNTIPRNFNSTIILRGGY
ncbi:MAG: hypothetical protein RL687_307 [Candidatus Parcubacteria bacterium]|jgi:Tfp pilus assembly protein PilW